MTVVNQEQFQEAKSVLDGFMDEPKLLPLNLQFFADDDGGSDDKDSDDDKDSGDDQDDKDSDDKKSDNDKKFSQEDVSNIAAREAKKAQEKLLKQLGVKDVKSAKDGLAEFKKLQDEQKTEAQKALDANKDLKETNETLSNENETLKAQLAALKQGTNSDSLDDVILLAKGYVNEDTDVDTAIEKVLEKYPHFKAVQEDNKDGKKKEDKKKKPKFSDSEHKNDDKETDNEKWAKAFTFSKQSN